LETPDGLTEEISAVLQTPDLGVHLPELVVQRPFALHSFP